ncbi:MAG: hypothetical protein AAF382_00390 [Pseudomonadota bacterium]
MKPTNGPEMTLDHTTLLGVRNLSSGAAKSPEASEKSADMAVQLGRLHSKVGATGEDF